MNKRLPVAAARILGAGLLALVAVIPAFLYEYGIVISAGLCGEGARWWITVMAIAVPLIVVGS
jgi:Sec-independent protein secretion pathway component TatC